MSKNDEDESGPAEDLFRPDLPVKRERRTDDGTYPNVEEEKAKLAERAAATIPEADWRCNCGILMPGHLTACVACAKPRPSTDDTLRKRVAYLEAGIANLIAHHEMVADEEEMRKPEDDQIRQRLHGRYHIRRLIAARLRNLQEGTLIVPEGKSCDLCNDDVSELFLRAVCHVTAPLRVSREGDVLILRCYVPECRREVARLQLAAST